MAHSGLHKMMVVGGINIISFSCGYLTGQIASMSSSLKTNEEGLDLQHKEISVIASSLYLFACVGLCLAAVVSDRVGRRWSFIFFSTAMTLNWIVLYCAHNMLAFMTSRLLAGVAVGGLYSLNLCTISEYTASRTRGVFLNMISTFAPAVATAIAHALGIVTHWRYVALVGIIPAVIGVILPYFWVESPHWLASKGRFDECEVAFRELHGNDFEAELLLLIKVEKAKLVKAIEMQSIETVRRLVLACKSRYFWDLMILSIFVYSFTTAGGKITFGAMCIVIIEEITGSRDVLFYTFVIDGLIITGSVMSCILITKLSMRNLLFTTGFIAIFVLVSLSACLYFNNGTVSFQWLSVILLAVYFFIIKSGPYPVLEGLLGEIYPLEVKAYCFFLSGLICMGGICLSILILPYMVNAMGYHGVFLLNAAIMSTSLVYIWMRLPETKGRTLQEIEIYFKTKTFENIDQALSNEQIKTFI